VHAQRFLPRRCFELAPLLQGLPSAQRAWGKRACRRPGRRALPRRLAYHFLVVVELTFAGQPVKDQRPRFGQCARNAAMSVLPLKATLEHPARCVSTPGGQSGLSGTVSGSSPVLIVLLRRDQRGITPQSWSHKRCCECSSGVLTQIWEIPTAKSRLLEEVLEPACLRAVRLATSGSSPGARRNPPAVGRALKRACEEVQADGRG
jgi:hypothetical protein